MRLKTTAQWLVIILPFAALIFIIFTLLTGTGIKDFSQPVGALPAASASMTKSGLYQESLPLPQTFSTRIADWDYILTARYRYTIIAKAIGKREYLDFGPDRISPMDIAVATGDIIKPENFEYFTFTQGNRNFFYSYRYPAGVKTLSKTYADEHMSNNHLVFLDESIHTAARRIAVGDCIRITGYLVDIHGTRDNGESYFRLTSITRSDSYPAGCEVVLVETITPLSC